MNTGSATNQRNPSPNQRTPIGSARQSPERSRVPKPRTDIPKNHPADQHIPGRLRPDPLQQQQHSDYYYDDEDEEAELQRQLQEDNAELYQRLKEGLDNIQGITDQPPFGQQQDEAAAKKYSLNLGRAEFGSLKRRDGSRQASAMHSRDPSGDRNRNNRMESSRNPSGENSSNNRAARQQQQSRDPSGDRFARGQALSRQTSNDSMSIHLGRSDSRASMDSFGGLSSNLDGPAPLSDLRPGMAGRNPALHNGPQAQTVTSRHVIEPSQAILEKKKEVLQNIAHQKKNVQEAKS